MVYHRQSHWLDEPEAESSEELIEKRIVQDGSIVYIVVATEVRHTAIIK